MCTRLMETKMTMQLLLSINQIEKNQQYLVKNVNQLIANIKEGRVFWSN